MDAFSRYRDYYVVRMKLLILKMRYPDIFLMIQSFAEYKKPVRSYSCNKHKNVKNTRVKNEKIEKIFKNKNLKIKNRFINRYCNRY